MDACISVGCSIGCTAFKQPKERTPLHVQVPVIKEILQGIEAGSLILKLGEAIGGKSFVYQVAKDVPGGNLEWMQYPDSRRQYQYDNLEQGVKYWFKVTSVGSNNQAVTSAVMACYVMQRSINNAA